MCVHERQRRGVCVYVTKKVHESERDKVMDNMGSVIDCKNEGISDVDAEQTYEIIKKTRK